jgi:hypothetical protein
VKVVTYFRIGAEYSSGGWFGLGRRTSGRCPTPGAALVGLSAPLTVELLYFEECPNHGATRASIERIAAEEDLMIDLRLIAVTSPEEVEATRFLGSPSIRVNGRDVEPGADDRETFVLACRLYQTEAGIRGQPSDDWIRAALR